MFHKEEYDNYQRYKMRLQTKIEEIGDYRGSREVEDQIRCVEGRLMTNIQHAYLNAHQELVGLNLILTESVKDK